VKNALDKEECRGFGGGNDMIRSIPTSFSFSRKNQKIEMWRFDRSVVLLASLDDAPQRLLLVSLTLFLIDDR
jgi:hypothetical protein